MLNPRQVKFCELYIKTGNETQAAKEAGYSERTAASQGSALLKKPEIKAYIRERMREINRELASDADEVIAFLAQVMRGEIKDQFGLDASLADRISAAKELNKRYAAAEIHAKSNTLKRIEFKELQFTEDEEWTK